MLKSEQELLFSSTPEIEIMETGQVSQYYFNWNILQQVTPHQVIWWDMLEE